MLRTFSSARDLLELGKMRDKKFKLNFHPIVDFKLCQTCEIECKCVNGAILHRSRCDKSVEVIVIPDLCDACGLCLVQCLPGAVKLLTMSWVQAITSDHFRDVGKKVGKVGNEG